MENSRMSDGSPRPKKKMAKELDDKQDLNTKKFNKLLEQVGRYPTLKQIILLKKKIEVSRKERRRTSNKLIKLKTGYVQLKQSVKNFLMIQNTSQSSNLRKKRKAKVN